MKAGTGRQLFQIGRDTRLPATRRSRDTIGFFSEIAQVDSRWYDSLEIEEEWVKTIAGFVFERITPLYARRLIVRSQRTYDSHKGDKGTRKIRPPFHETGPWPDPFRQEAAIHRSHRAVPFPPRRGYQVYRYSFTMSGNYSSPLFSCQL